MCSLTLHVVHMHSLIGELCLPGLYLMTLISLGIAEGGRRGGRERERGRDSGREGGGRKIIMILSFSALFVQCMQMRGRENEWGVNTAR